MVSEQFRIVPSGIGQTNAHQQHTKQFENAFATPVAIDDREIETLQKMYQLAAFVASETFDHEINPVLELDIEDYVTRTIDLSEEEETTSKVAA